MLLFCHSKGGGVLRCTDIFWKNIIKMAWWPYCSRGEEKLQSGIFMLLFHHFKEGGGGGAGEVYGSYFLEKHN